MARARARTRLGVASVRKTGVRELSAVAIARGRIYVADDELGVGVLPRRGDARFPESGALEGVEGLAADAKGTCLYAVGEMSRRLHRLPLGRDGSIGRPVDLGKLPRPGDARNKGWEGIAWLPRAFGPERRNRLVIVNEDKPRRVGLFSPRDLDDPVMLRLPDELRGALDDLSDVAVDPVTGRLWLLSHESSAIGIASLVKDAGGALALRSHEVVPLPVTDAQSEGIAFAGRNRLLLASEVGGLLHTLTVQRGSAGRG